MNRISKGYATGLMAGVGLLALSAGAAQAQDEPMFEVYGFAQVDYIQDFARVDPDWESTLRPSKIPTIKGAYGDDGDSVLSVKQSRLGVQTRQQLAGKPFYAKFEFDLYGTGVDAGQTTFRLRHVYGEWGQLLVGQTNSLFMDIDTFPNTVDYWGPNGMVFLRNPQVRYTWKTNSGHFALAIEKPGNDIDVGQVRQLDPDLGSAIQAQEEFPDLTAQWRHNGDWGHFQLAGIVRNVGYDTAGTVNNEPKDSSVGWGVNASSNIKVGMRNVIHLSAVYGEGIASYMNDGGMDMAPQALAYTAPPIFPAPPPPPGSITGETVPLLGLVAYYDHYWNDAWSSSLGWSMVDVENTNFQGGDAFHSAEYASANVLYQPDPKILMGAELLWGNREDFDGNKGDDTRVQFTFKYSFSSKDFIR